MSLLSFQIETSVRWMATVLAKGILCVGLYDLTYLSGPALLSACLLVWLSVLQVLKYAPEMRSSGSQRRPRVRWVIDEIFLTHHEKCHCVCPSRPPR